MGQPPLDRPAASKFVEGRTVRDKYESGCLAVGADLRPIGTETGAEGDEAGRGGVVVHLQVDEPAGRDHRVSCHDVAVSACRGSGDESGVAERLGDRRVTSGHPSHGGRVADRIAAAGDLRGEVGVGREGVVRVARGLGIGHSRVWLHGVAFR